MSLGEVLGSGFEVLCIAAVLKGLAVKLSPGEEAE